MSQTSALRTKEHFYDTIADRFDDVMNEYDVGRRLSVVFDEFLKDIDLGGCRFLDAGCGTGRFSARACVLGASVVSLDIGRALLQQVIRKCPAMPACGDITRLPFLDNSFDVIVSSECIEHTPRPEQAVHEMLRVLRPGGRLVITCPNRFWYWSCVVANRLKLRPYEGIENWPGWYQLRRWITRANGEILQSCGIHLFPFVLSSTNGVLKLLDRLGRQLGPLYLNQAVSCTK